MKMKKSFITTLTAFMLITPFFSMPKLPTIPTINTTKIELPVGAQEAAKNAGIEAVKNLNIDWSKINFKFN